MGKLDFIGFLSATQNPRYVIEVPLGISGARLVDLQTDKSVAQISTSGNAVSGQLLASYSQDGVLTLERIGESKPLVRVRIPVSPLPVLKTVAVSPALDTIALATGGDAAMYSVTTGKRIAPVPGLSGAWFPNDQTCYVRARAFGLGPSALESVDLKSGAIANLATLHEGPYQNEIISSGYDSRGNRTSVTDAMGHVTTFTYDLGNRLTQIAYPDNSTVIFGYDYRGRRTSMTDQNGKTTTYTYDDADRLTSVTDAAGNVTQYGYDTENNLTSITDANGHTTNFQYDAYGHVTQTTFPSNYFETYSYDADNNLTSKTDRNGNTIQYVYDALDRLTQKNYPDSTSADYTYDLVGKVLQVNDPTGTYASAYDNMGRLIGTTTTYSFLPNAPFANSYTYDADSNRTGYAAPDGSTNTYTYDTLNRLTALANSWAGSFGFSYDSLSRRTQMTRPNGISTNYTYDSLSRLLSVLHQAGGSTIDGAVYTLDAAGNRSAKTDDLAGVTSGYTYDKIYELTQVLQGANTTESYSYDSVGNRLSSLSLSPYNYNTSNQLTSTPSASYAYDSNGNTTGKTDSTGTTTYSWDYENRMTSATLPGTGGTTTFKYDPFGRRIEKISPTTTSIFAYDGDNLVETANASGGEVASYAQGDSIDEPLAMDRSGTVDYYEQDGVGSVTSLTASTGSIAQSYTYDSFGNTTNSTGSLTNFFRYTGREFDTETSLYYYRARYYDPTTGTFLSEDPIRWFSGTADFYDYVHNAPVNLIDPLGLRASKTATADCIERALQALFPGVIASVGPATNEVGGHWNFSVQLQFSSTDAANAFYSAYTTSAANGWPPPARFGSGPALHLENLGGWSPLSGTPANGTAHIDLYNPNDGLGGIAGHVGVDGLVGHLSQIFHSNIDPSTCPWGKGCQK